MKSRNRRTKAEEVLRGEEVSFEGPELSFLFNI
jgi:hypothetical protein